MTDDMINISEIRNQIDAQIDSSELIIPGIKKDLVNSVLSSGEYKEHSLDKIHQWVIRSYLVNARLQNLISDSQWISCIKLAKTGQGREQLAVSILLSSISMIDVVLATQLTKVEAK